MIYGAIIDGVNTLEEYGLYLTQEIEIEAPAKKTNYLNIPGADGSIDLSDHPQGRPVYADREIGFELFKPVDDFDLRALRTEMMNRWHGRKVKLHLPDDPAHYFYGVLNIGKQKKFNTGIIPCVLLCDPWRYKNDVTSVTVNLSAGGNTLHLTNERRPVNPKFTVQGSATVVTDNGQYVFEDGTYIELSIILGEGDNVITVSGTGTLTIEYQEGSF